MYKMYKMYVFLQKSKMQAIGKRKKIQFSIFHRSILLKTQ